MSPSPDDNLLARIMSLVKLLGVYAIRDVWVDPADAAKSAGALPVYLRDTNQCIGLVTLTVDGRPFSHFELFKQLLDIRAKHQPTQKPA